MSEQPLAYSIYRPNQKPKAIIQILHGMMDHRKRYDYFAKALCSAGFAVITYDQRGHGETAHHKDDLGYFADDRGWKLLIDDCENINRLIRQEYPGIPLILFGHSMGSIVARSFIKRYDKEVDGLILCGAPNYNKMVPMMRKLTHALSVVSGKKRRIPLLKELILGQFNKQIVNAKTTSDWISKNEDNVQEYLQDSWCQFNFTNIAYEDLMFGMQDMNDTLRWNLQNSNLPILFVAGQEDPCTGLEKGLQDSAFVLKEAGYTFVEHLVYGNLRHEILNEKERDQVIQDLIRWVEKNVLDQSKRKRETEEKEVPASTQEATDATAFDAEEEE